MKKHPVDDLFARKLDDWQPKPSPDLWKRIEDRQEGRVRRLTGWYWYAAASVVLVLMAGYVVWQSQSKVLPGTNRELAKVKQIRQSKENASSLRDLSPDSGMTLSNRKLEENESGVVVKDIRLTNPKMYMAAKIKSNVQSQVQELDAVSDNVEVAAIQKKETDSESLIQDSKSKTSFQPLDIRPEIANESLIDQAKERVIIVHIETDDVNQEGQKTSKLIRILRQLKNAKQGEAIEWDEVGFNPKKLVARADERLRNEEEKVSKRYQELKDKTKL